MGLADPHQCSGYYRYSEVKALQAEQICAFAARSHMLSVFSISIVSVHLVSSCYSFLTLCSLDFPHIPLLSPLHLLPSESQDLDHSISPMRVASTSLTSRKTEELSELCNVDALLRLLPNRAKDSDVLMAVLQTSSTF